VALEPWNLAPWEKSVEREIPYVFIGNAEQSERSLIHGQKAARIIHHNNWLGGVGEKFGEMGSFSRKASCRR